MKTRTALAGAAMALLACAGPMAAQTVIEGHLTDILGEPRVGAEIRIVGTRAHATAFTDRDGNYRVTNLPSGYYTVVIPIASRENFIASHIGTLPGDPWHIDFDSRYWLATLRSDHSKKTRRFAWQGERTGSHLGGRWMETTSEIGYEPDAQNVVTRSGLTFTTGGWHPRGKPDAADLKITAR